ncbi:hypothetical protein Tco_1237247 [Tanacetum coccineum]
MSNTEQPESTVNEYLTKDNEFLGNSDENPLEYILNITSIINLFQSPGVSSDQHDNSIEPILYQLLEIHEDDDNPALFAANSIDDEKTTPKLKELPSHLEYAFLDNNHSPWVSPIHVVPKKGGTTVIANKDNKLVPTRTVTGWRGKNTNVRNNVDKVRLMDQLFTFTQPKSKEFTIEIKDKKGTENLAADHLSRLENPGLEELSEDTIQDNFPNKHLMVKMEDPNITIEEYIRLKEEKARRRGKMYNWETAMYGKIWDNEDVHGLGCVETEFPAIVFNDMLTSEAALSCEPTVSSLNNAEIDFRILFDESDDEDYMDNDDDKIDIDHSSGDLSVKPLPDLINTDVGAYAHGYLYDVSGEWIRDRNLKSGILKVLGLEIKDRALYYSSGGIGIRMV